MESPLTDPLAMALFVHHRELAIPGLNERVMPVIVPGLPRYTEDKIRAFRRMRSNVVSLPTASVIDSTVTVRPSVRTVIFLVSRFYELSPRDLLGHDRRMEVARARQVAMFLARKLAGRSLLILAREFERDHTTILHGIRKIAELALKEDRLQDELDVLRLHILDQVREAA